MKPIDLRLNNYVEYRNEICLVAAIDNQKVALFRPTGYSYNVPSNDITPIPLSEDLLQRLGFKKSLVWTIRLNMNTIKITKEEDKFFFEFNISGCVRIEYVHELQNLVYALCKTDLTLKPTQE